MASAEFGLGPGPAAAEEVACLVLGNFDGVHLGHQAILAAGRRVARGQGRQLVAITFQPHPRAAINPGQGPPLLSPPALRRRLLLEHGVDRVWVLPFTSRLRELSPAEFLDRVRGRLLIREMVVGPRVSLGPPGQGGLDFLRAYAGQVGFKVKVIAGRVSQGQPVSSSVIRDRLQEGRLDQVARMLGRSFEVLGRVELGMGLGRRLGFPTANLALHPDQALPPDGVYVMRFDGGDGRPASAVGSIGVRPHFDMARRVFEVHALEDPGDLYGRWLRVSVLSRIREQHRFGSDQELVAQMGHDREAARAYLAAGAPA